jgi:hypothetical protein
LLRRIPSVILDLVRGRGRGRVRARSRGRVRVKVRVREMARVPRVVLDRVARASIERRRDLRNDEPRKGQGQGQGQG